MTVSLFATDAQISPLLSRLEARLSEVLQSGRYILGPEVSAFEQELAGWLGAAHVIGVANGTDAITIALRALGLKPGDEVVIPSFTFYATAEAAASAGIVPVFCDVDPNTRNVTAKTVRAALTPRVRAIIAVDLFGCPAPIPELREFGLPILEDAAQALGARLDGRCAATLGDLATLSFYPSKNLGCLGDGGAVVTDDPDLAERVRTLRFHGSRDKESFELVGYNSRLDELQAGALRVMLPALSEWSEARRQVGLAYERGGLGRHVGLPSRPTGAEPAWHIYTVTDPDPEGLRAALAEAGVEARGYYRVPVHRQPAMHPFRPAGELPVTDWLAASNLALPAGIHMGEPEVATVLRAVAVARPQAPDAR